MKKIKLILLEGGDANVTHSAWRIDGTDYVITARRLGGSHKSWSVTRTSTWAVMDGKRVIWNDDAIRVRDIKKHQVSVAKAFMEYQRGLDRGLRTAPVDLPLPAFSNIINSIHPDFSFRHWRGSLEWRIFVAGYNAAMDDISWHAKAKHDMGMNTERLYGANNR